MALSQSRLWISQGDVGSSQQMTASFRVAMDDAEVRAPRSITWIRVGSILVVAAIAAAGLRSAAAEELVETTLGHEAGEPAGTHTPPAKGQPPPSPSARPPIVRRVLLGQSARGRSIPAFELGDPT